MWVLCSCVMSKAGGWNDDNCAVEAYVLCQVPDGSTEAPTQAPTVAPLTGEGPGEFRCTSGFCGLINGTNLDNPSNETLSQELALAVQTSVAAALNVSTSSVNITSIRITPVARRLASVWKRVLQSPSNYQVCVRPATHALWPLQT